MLFTQISFYKLGNNGFEQRALYKSDGNYEVLFRKKQ